MPGGRDVYVVCLRDISKRKEAERALRESEARYRTLVENAAEAPAFEKPVQCQKTSVRRWVMRGPEGLARVNFDGHRMRRRVRPVVMAMDPEPAHADRMQGRLGSRDPVFAGKLLD